MKLKSVGMAGLFVFAALAVIVGGLQSSEAAPGGKILIVHADVAGSPPSKELLATGLFDTVDLIDASTRTPSLSELTPFNAVLAYTNLVPLDRVALGNVLADYVDAGGRVVLGAFAYSSALAGDPSIKGRIVTPGFSPLKDVGTLAINDVSGSLVAESQQVNDPIFVGPVTGLKPIDLAAVTYFHNKNFSLPGLDTGATLLATDGSGAKVNMIAKNSNGRVIGLNMCPGTTGCSSGTSGNNSEFYRLLANTLLTPLNADLVITKTASPDPGEVGSDLAYTLKITNIGPDAASGVVVKDTLPAQVTLVSAKPSVGICSVTSSTVTCNLGILGKLLGASATVTLVVTPGVTLTTPTTISNTATVTSDVPDPDATNNSATAGTTVWGLLFTDGTNSLGVNTDTGAFTLTFVVDGKPQLCSSTSSTRAQVVGTFLTISGRCQKDSGTTIRIRAVSPINGIMTVVVTDQIGPATTDRVTRRFILPRLALRKVLPTITLALSGCTRCRAGDLLTLQARVTNPGSVDAPVEVKLDVTLPTGEIFNIGQVPFTLPANLDTTVPLIENLPLPAGLPTGIWQFEGALLETELGQRLSHSAVPFEVIP